VFVFDLLGQLVDGLLAGRGEVLRLAFGEEIQQVNQLGVWQVKISK
jgi:hypothetical protein